MKHFISLPKIIQGHWDVVPSKFCQIFAMCFFLSRVYYNLEDLMMFLIHVRWPRLVVIGWFLVVGTWILCGIFILLRK